MDAARRDDPPLGGAAALGDPRELPSRELRRDTRALPHPRDVFRFQLQQPRRGDLLARAAFKSDRSREDTCQSRDHVIGGCRSPTPRVKT